MLNRRDAMLASVMLGIGAPSFAQSYPQRPVRIIVPYSPGGATDVYARIMAKHMGDTFGQPFIVENKAGAATIIGAEAVASAKPDGHTLLFSVAATVATNQFLYKKLPYKPEDLMPISLVGTSRYTLTINADLPAKNIQEFVKYVKDRPGKVVMATLGSGSGGYLAAKNFEKVYGLDMIEVPYKGSADANHALLSGTAALYPDGISGVLALHKAGRVRIIAVTSTTRSPDIPDVPTMVELGFPDFIVSNWFALFAPRGTPPDIVAQLNAAVVKTVASSEFRSALLQNGIDPESSTPAELGALIRRTTEANRKMLGQLGIQPG